MTFELDDLKKFWQFLQFAYNKNKRIFSNVPMFTDLFGKYLTKSFSKDDGKFFIMKQQLALLIKLLEDEIDLEPECQIAKNISEDLEGNSSQTFNLATQNTDLLDILNSAPFPTQQKYSHLIFLEEELQNQYNHYFDSGVTFYQATNFGHASACFKESLKLLPEFSPQKSVSLYQLIDSLLKNKSFLEIPGIITEYKDYFYAKNHIPNFIFNIAQLIYAAATNLDAIDSSHDLALYFAGLKLLGESRNENIEPDYLELIFSINYFRATIKAIFAKTHNPSNEETRSQIEKAIGALNQYKNYYVGNEMFKQQYNDTLLVYLKEISLLLESEKFFQEAYDCNQIYRSCAINNSDKYYADFKISMIEFIQKLSMPNNIKLMTQAIAFFTTSLDKFQEFPYDNGDEIIVFGIKIAIIIFMHPEFLQHHAEAKAILEKILKQPNLISEKTLEGLGFLFTKIPDASLQSFSMLFENYLLIYGHSIAQLAPEFLGAWFKNLTTFNLAANTQFKFVIQCCQFLLDDSNYDQANDLLTEYLQDNDKMILQFCNNEFFNLLLKMSNYYHQSGKKIWDGNNKNAAFSFFKIANFYYSFLYAILSIKNNGSPPNGNEITIAKKHFEILISLGEISLAEEVIQDYEKFSNDSSIAKTIEQFKKIVANNKEKTLEIVNALNFIWEKRSQSFKSENTSEPKLSNNDPMEWKKN